MNWTFWLSIVSPHMSELMRSLASMPDQTVTVVAEHEVAERRLALGWNKPDCSPARVLIKPQDAEIDRLIGQGHGHESIHMVGAGKRGSLNRRVLPHLAKTGAMVGLILETGDNRGILGLARRIKYFLDRYSVEDKMDFILAMGQLGVRWYECAGYDSSRIFPFMYVPERPVPPSESRNHRNDTDTFRIVFLGRIVRLKDGITAVRALAGLSAYDWQFDVVGNGPELARWKKAAAESGVADRIRFLPPINNRMIGNLFEHADLLLLPSRKDGWGAVVNEALMCGVPVVCSDNCGAADLLREPWRGSTFKAGSVESLRSVLQGWIERGKRNEASSARIKKWSYAIEGPQVARYLVEVVKYLQEGGQRPFPPWY
jgi:glycosyltransferase involved in cell wall biosynthesis